MNIKVNNLSKIHNGRIIINNISFTLDTGEIAIFLGKSGAGKSTLLKILNHLDNDYQGNITIDGNPLTIMRQHIGLVFQDFNLFNYYSVLKNITLPLEVIQKKSPAEAESIAKDFLKHYELLDFQNRSIKDLSGGQKQRLAIARTLAMQPHIICFDEPLSALDPYLTKYIITQINTLKKNGYIIVLTTHNISILEQIEGTIYLLDNGIIKEKMTTKEFYSNQKQSLYINKFINGSEE